jgi:Lrp/AsnC family transcriptional regulator, leucine-responsive regulatory protein
MQANYDELDREILMALQLDARLSTAQLGERIHTSQSPAWRRLKRLEDSGIITGYRAELNPRKVGYGVLAFVQVSVDRQDEQSSDAFEAGVQQIPEILLCHGVSGPEDFMLMIAARDLEDYSQILLKKLRTLPGVKSIRSSFSLKSIKHEIAMKLHLA